MNKPLFLFIGKSASGKTTIANLLEQKYNYKQVHSYTTRQPRYDGEIGHVFVTKEEFDNLGELAAYTFYDGNEYGTTFEQLEGCTIFVVDVPGAESLLKKHQSSKRPISIIYFNTTVTTRIKRMIDRHDSDIAIIARLLQDEEYDWGNKLSSVIWKHNNLQYGIDNRAYVDMHSINANGELDEIMEQVLYYINKSMED